MKSIAVTALSSQPSKYLVWTEYTPDDQALYIHAVVPVSLGYTGSSWVQNPYIHLKIELNNAAIRALLPNIDSYKVATAEFTQPTWVDYYLVIALHEPTFTVDRSIVFISIDEFDMIITREIRSSDTNIVWEIVSFVHNSYTDYVTVRDPVQDKSWLLYDFSASVLNDVPSMKSLSFISTNSDPSFDYLSRI